MFYTSIGDGREGVRSFLEKRPPEFKASVSTDLQPFYGEWISMASGSGREAGSDR